MLDSVILQSAESLAPQHDPVRLSPAGVLLWRSGRSVQLEIGLRRVVIEGTSPETVRALLTPPTHEPGDEPAPELGWLRGRLVDHGFLWPGDEEFHPPVPRLFAEQTALAARYGAGAADLVAARGRRSVVVQGSGRAATTVASLVAAAGVGRVHVADAAPIRLAHALPGGVTPAAEGHRLTDAAAAAVAGHAPEVDTTAPAFGQRPDLVVLAVDAPVDSDVRDALHAREIAHLTVRLGPGSGAVGPLVVPGLTSCLACADLHRRDRDDAWPAIAAQLSVARRYPEASETALAAMIAGLAAAQALAFLDGEEPATRDGTLEIQPPDWRVRRRSWSPHLECPCRAAAQDVISAQ